MWSEEELDILKTKSDFLNRKYKKMIALNKYVNS